MDSAFNPKHHNKPREDLSFWQHILNQHPAHEAICRQAEHEQRVYRENKLSQHITPHLLDQATSLSRILKAR